MKKKKTESVEVSVQEIKQKEVTFCLVGKSPLICNRMSQKVLQELLFPAKKKNAAERATTLKHDPLQEYRNSPYTTTDDTAPTRITMLATSFKGALRSAALEIAGATKAQIGRLTYIEGDTVSIYGAPQMLMATVRQAGMNRTPDVRTRAILPRWAASVTIQFVSPQLSTETISNLFAGAGVFIGVGDWRPEKGNGNYGQFELVPGDDKRFAEIVKTGGIAEQDAALDSPEFYDKETADLYTWFSAEAKVRDRKIAAAS